MRAIIRCESNQDKAAFELLLKEIKWWPNLQQDDEEVVKHRTRIISMVSTDDAELVKKTEWFMIFSHRVGKTWGLVNSPQNGIVEIRFKNKSSYSLRRACENFIESVQNSKEGKKYSFDTIIEVLEPNSQTHAFYGKVLPTAPGEKLKLAKKERSVEFFLSKIFILIALGMIALTFPAISSIINRLIGELWGSWLSSTIGRTGTTFIASSFVSGLTVVLHYQELKRLGAIRWILKRDDMNY